jgi:hypothetical protein
MGRLARFEGYMGMAFSTKEGLCAHSMAKSATREPS